MAELNLSIDGLYKAAFGIGRGNPFDASQSNESTISAAEYHDEPDVLTDEDSEFVHMRDVLGSNLPSGRSVFMPVQIGELLLPNEPTVFISGRKEIVKTRLAGSKRKGSVKELIGVDDYVITIRGIAITHNSTTVYPEATVKGIIDLYNQNASLEIRSAITNLLGIYRVVIESIDFPEMIGVQHAQAYQLKCVSDEEFVLEI